MYGNYDNDYEENDIQNKSSLDKLVSYLPSTKVLGIIVLVEIIIFAIVMFMKDKNDSLVISLENNPEYLLVNDTKKINFKVDGESYNGNYNNVNIKVDKSMLASVNNGMITAGSVPGSSNLLVVYTKDGKSFMGSGRLIVYMGDKNTIVTDIVVPSDVLTIKLGSTFDLASNISFTPSNGYIEKIEYYNADTKVIKIDDYGKIEGLSLGESNVTIAINDNLRKNLKVIVTDSDENLGFGNQDSTDGGEIQSITFNQPEITITNNIAELKMKKGDVYNLIPVIVPSNATNKSLTFEAMDKTILQVTPNMNNTTATITALKKGTTTITVKSANGKMGVLNVTVSGSSSSNSNSNSSGACYCNTSLKKCNWDTGISGGYNSKQSSIANSTACTIYSNNNMNACFKDKDGNYKWGQYGNSGYSYVPGVASPGACKSDNQTKSSITCSNVYVDSEGKCVITTSTSDKISSASINDESIAKKIGQDTYKVTYKCLKKGMTSVSVKTSQGDTISSNISCLEKEIKESISCPKVTVGKSVTCSVSYGTLQGASVSNSAIATVITSGTTSIRVTGVSVGKTIGYATINGQRVSFNIEVVKDTSTTKSTNTESNDDKDDNNPVKDAEIVCTNYTHIRNKSSSVLIAKCTNCNITSNNKTFDAGTYTVKASANTGHLFKNGSSTATKECTIK